MAKCDCYYQHGTKFVCYGTKEREECSCGGNESKCNFYPEKRKPKMANEKRLIDANALKKEIVDWKVNLHPKNADYGTGYFSALSAVEGMLAYAPTVDAVEVVHGRWEEYPDRFHVRCTNCRMEFKKDKFPIIGNYCPNCGAKMDGDGNED